MTIEKVRKDYEKRNRLRKKFGGTKIMGMSASQMRYCLIAGRKSDVEYQGQQINQQRTTLATVSSSYNSELLNLTVPTPPSTSDYTKTSYTFTNNGNTCEIDSNLQYQSSDYTANGRTYKAGTYIVPYNYDTTEDIGKLAGSKSVTNASGNYTVSGNSLTALDFTAYLAGTSTDKNYQEQAENFSNILKICQDCNLTVPEYDSDNNAATTNNLTTISTTDQLKAFLTQNPNAFYSYSSTDGVPKYTISSQLPTSAQGTGDAYFYYVDDDADTTVSDDLYGAEITWSDSGRMSSITVTDSDDNDIVYSLTSTTTTDNDAYKDAYNEYEYQKGQYDNEIQKINAQLSVIEQQDRTLELKLKDLDTQQEALNTEMDSVKKVIDKNIENSFKTFA